MSKSGASMRAWVLSKVINFTDGVGAVFKSSEYVSLTGHEFSQEKDFVAIMNGAELQAGDNSPGTFTIPSYNGGSKDIYTWTRGPNGQPNDKNGAARVNILVVSTA